MPEFKVYYWVQQGERGRAVCESVTADSIDGATQYAQDNLQKPSFAFDSDQDGRVIVVSSHIQYIEIEDAHANGDGPNFLQIA